MRRTEQQRRIFAVPGYHLNVGWEHLAAGAGAKNVDGFLEQVAQPFHAFFH